MITIRNLTRKYGSIVAVDDLTLQIQRGEVVGLLGHNGAGKTTVMRILTGFLEPSSGTVTVGGIAVSDDRRGVQRQIGYLPENAPLYPEMLAQEYLRMMAELRGVPTDQLDRAVADAGRATGLEDHMAQPIATLSKGYRQRVGLAQAIVHKPEVLVLDEPTNGLDPVQIQSIRGLIRRLAESTTIILSTHILQEIEAVCDRLVVLIEGGLAADGSLSSLLTSSQVGLSLRGPNDDETEVAARLAAIAGVRSARRSGEDPDNPGFGLWTLECEPGMSAVPAIIEAGHDAGWTLAAATPRRRTLESFFEELQEEHIARQRAPESQAGTGA